MYEDYPISLGETVDLDAKAEITGRYELYVFVKIDPSAAFTLNGFDTAVWKPITDGSNVYYYGSVNALVPLGGENGKSVDIIKSFTFSATTTNTDDYTLDITGYAIQADAVESGTSPAAVYDMIVGD